MKTANILNAEIIIHDFMWREIWITKRVMKTASILNAEIIIHDFRGREIEITKRVMKTALNAEIIIHDLYSARFESLFQTSWKEKLIGCLSSGRFEAFILVSGSHRVINLRAQS